MILKRKKMTIDYSIRAYDVPMVTPNYMFGPLTGIRIESSGEFVVGVDTLFSVLL